MQIGTHSSQETLCETPKESRGQPSCPLCGGALVPLRNSYRCSRCAYHLCAGCEPIETGPVSE